MRHAILSAAERVFSREGEAGLSIRRLAEEIDYSPSAIYKYFASKDELLDALKEAFFERLMSGVDEARLATLPFLQRARECISLYVAKAIERPFHYAAAFSSVACGQYDNDHPKWDEFSRTHKGRAFMVIVRLVSEGQRAGTVDPSLDPYRTAKSLWASMHGLAMLIIHMPQFSVMTPDCCRGETPESFVAYHTSMLLRGLEARSVNPSSGSCNGHDQS